MNVSDFEHHRYCFVHFQNAFDTHTRARTNTENSSINILTAFILEITVSSRLYTEARQLSVTVKLQNLFENLCSFHFETFYIYSFIEKCEFPAIFAGHKDNKLTVCLFKTT